MPCGVDGEEKLGTFDGDGREDDRRRSGLRGRLRRRRRRRHREYDTTGGGGGRAGDSSGAGEDAGAGLELVAAAAPIERETGGEAGGKLAAGVAAALLGAALSAAASGEAAAAAAAEGDGSPIDATATVLLPPPRLGSGGREVRGAGAGGESVADQGRPGQRERKHRRGGGGNQAAAPGAEPPLEKTVAARALQVGSRGSEEAARRCRLSQTF